MSNKSLPYAPMEQDIHPQGQAVVEIVAADHLDAASQVTRFGTGSSRTSSECSTAVSSRTEINEPRGTHSLFPRRPEAAHVQVGHNQRHSDDRLKSGEHKVSIYASISAKGSTSSDLSSCQDEFALESWTPGTHNFSLTDSQESFDNEKAVASATISPLQFASKIARTEFLESYAKTYPMPQLVGPLWFLKLRYGFLTVYRRLFAVVVTANIIAITILATRGTRTKSSQAAIGVGSCVFAAVLARFEPLINGLMTATHLVPLSWPISIRKRIAKVYSHGGIHSGFGASAAAWYVYFIVLLVLQRAPGHEGIQIGIYLTTAIIFACLLIMIGMSHPTFRSRHHDLWEHSHRYIGWLLTAAMLTQVFLFCASSDRSFGSAVLRSSSFWQVMAVICLLVYPWAVMRKRSFVATQLASHAVRLDFDHRRPRTGHSIRLGTKPLEDWHAFATIPRADGTKGFSVIISNAGDWTRDMVTSKDRSNKIWVRGRLFLGVMEVPMLFSPLVIAATGSGIAPCMAFINTHPGWPVRVIWSARRPEQTYGSEIMETVLRADPNAVIIDTTQTGRPNMSALVYAAYQEIKAEAVLFVSTAKVSEAVRFDMEARGVPFLAPVFDS